MYTLRVKDHFDAAHFLPWHEGKCKNLHGHRWEVEVVVQRDHLDDYGVLVDFAIVKEKLKLTLPDHTCLNDVLDNPTAEILAAELYEHIKSTWQPGGIGLDLVEVTVWESPNCSVTYKPEE